MSENSFYKVIVKTDYEGAKGQTKTRRDEYIVEGVSPTDVEAKMTKELEGFDFEIAQITLTKIISIVR
ncbi:MAG TPA: hypothetical protein PK122_00045 [Candidatus Paceibacterota bacterium]|nr:hypothetical protein [Candidatus Paceibacterota bacterium]